jgi:hypothetical protein
MSWISSLVMMVIFVGLLGVILSLPPIYQSPVLYILPLIAFLGFLYTLGA